MELKGKKAVFLGDSITEGVGTSNIEQVYWKQFGRMTGAQVFGYGISGTTIAAQKCQLSEQEMRYFATRVEDMIPDADIVVVFGGTNDFGHGDAPLGKVTDTQTDYFCGAFHDLLCRLIERYPRSQLLVMTPLHRDGENDLGPNEIGVWREHTLEDYVNAEIAISGFYAVPVLDLYRISGIQPAVPVLKQQYLPDGLHPNDAGNQLIARKLAGFLQIL